ncbi:unnamed protein product [Paramecium sonneborni]|uniref:Uncharacterized protein n=1 Tax=Paramecium sonneborni TaxID=65129 RepID=A0A8S1PD64_9CILI|nr:unnamed protein product [Paramecium sonneborni]
MDCAYHNKKQVSLICIAPHKCQFQRKLCVECLSDHGINFTEQTVSIDRFGEILIKKLKESQLNETSEFNKQRMNFKSILSQIKSMMTKIWEDLIPSINQVYDMIEQENTQYINLISNNMNIAKSSYSDLEKLVQIIVGNTLNLWNTQKNFYLMKLEKAKNWWVQEIQAFNQKIKKEMNQIHLISQQDLLSNSVQEVKPLIQSEVRDQVKTQSQKEFEHQQLQQQFQQQIQIKLSSQFNFKPFNYQIIEDNSIQQKETCHAVAINKDCSVVAAGCNKQIKIYQFQQGMLQLNQLLNKHKICVTVLQFMKQSNKLISGDYGLIFIWAYKNKSWICSSIIKGHTDHIRCIILNNNEDLFISSSYDKTIKFWVKQNKWICQQIITDHSDWVHQLSLNEQQNQVISCGTDRYILVIEQQENNKNWIVKQKIQGFGYRLCFINDNIFTFQSVSGNLIHVYQLDSVIIFLNQGNEGSILFPQQFIKQKQLLVTKYAKFVNLIRFTENAEFELEQSIYFGTNQIFGQMSDDGEYLITWDETSTQIQIRRFKEN